MMNNTNNLIGIGCDIVCISRIRKQLTNPRFCKKIFTLYEQDYVQNHSAQTAAGIWAAKEAVSKALGTGFVGFTAKDIEIRHNQQGQPMSCSTAEQDIKRLPFVASGSI